MKQDKECNAASEVYLGNLKVLSVADGLADILHQNLGVNLTEYLVAYAEPKPNRIIKIGPCSLLY